MRPEAERAYRQALYLWPANTETTSNLVNLLSAEGRFKDARDLIAESLPIDPNSKVLQRLRVATEARLKASQELPAELMMLQGDPKNRQLLAPVIQNLMILGRQPEIDTIVLQHDCRITQRHSIPARHDQLLRHPNTDSQGT